LRQKRNKHKPQTQKKTDTLKTKENYLNEN